MSDEQVISTDTVMAFVAGEVQQSYTASWGATPEQSAGISHLTTQAIIRWWPEDDSELAHEPRAKRACRQAIFAEVKNDAVKQFAFTTFFISFILSFLIKLAINAFFKWYNRNKTARHPQILQMKTAVPPATWPDRDAGTDDFDDV